jgi:hypothetical protein
MERIGLDPPLACCKRGNTVEGTMRKRQFTVLAIGVVFTMLAATAGAAARTPVDPTTLTPPLKPFRVCWELGPYVQCDTSGNSAESNVPDFESPCGQIYVTSEGKSNSTRWYRDGLIIRRQVEDSDRGFWTLSPTGGAPRVDFMRNNSWNELFAIPGDITSGVATFNGANLRVPALGVDLHEAGQVRPDETVVGASRATTRSATNAFAPCSRVRDWSSALAR